MYMKKYLLIILGIVLSATNSSYCANIVYPKSKNVTINSPVTAFIGNEKTKTLTINGEKVNIHKTGGFKHSVKLNYGINIFKINNGTEEIIYKITRNNLSGITSSIKPITYNTPLNITIKDDNTPLRSTPVNAGLNRLQHLPVGTELNAIGEYGNFYKIQLARDDFAWISKNNSKKNETCINTTAQLLNTTHSTEKTQEIFTFKLNKKVPYVLSEANNGYDLTIYGLNSEIHPFGKYEFHIPSDKKKFGYSSYFNDNNELIVKINKFIPKIKDLTITIDAGHGGSEIGAIGCLGNKEKDFNLSVAKKLQKILTDSGAKVVMTRDTDKYVSLTDRTKIANNSNSQIFISIHANALPDSLLDKNITGTEVYYFYPQAKALGQEILTSITSKVGTKNGGVKGQSFAVVRNTNALSILLEVGYMIDPEEDSKLADEKFQNDVAQAIKEGIEKFLK